MSSSRALLRQRDTFFAWAAAHADRFALGAGAHAVRRAYLRVRDGLTARLRDGTVATLRPATAFDGPDSRTYESANRVTKCADAPGPAPRRILADIRRTRTLDPPRPRLLARRLRQRRQHLRGPDGRRLPRRRNAPDDGRTLHRPRAARGT